MVGSGGRPVSLRRSVFPPPMERFCVELEKFSSTMSTRIGLVFWSGGVSCGLLVSEFPVGLFFRGCFFRSDSWAFGLGFFQALFVRTSRLFLFLPVVPFPPYIFPSRETSGPFFFPPALFPSLQCRTSAIDGVRGTFDF